MLIFIVPYRDREQQMLFFNKHMSENILEDENDFRILFIHQKDERPFNRGAMKNIGFLVVKDLYPDNYKDITLVFNDVDTVPYTKNFIDYQTETGIVKHFFGFKFALGGILSIKANDFEKVNGFPNLWTWGYEDNELNDRINENPDIIIDRNQFYEIRDRNILHVADGISKIRNKLEQFRYLKQRTSEGISDINDLKYSFNNNIVDVTEFTTAVTAPTWEEMEISNRNQAEFIKDKKNKTDYLVYEEFAEKLPEKPQYQIKKYNNSKIGMSWLEEDVTY